MSLKTWMFRHSNVSSFKTHHFETVQYKKKFKKMKHILRTLR